MNKALIILIILIVILALLIYVSVRHPSKTPLTRLIRMIMFLGLVIAIVIIAVREYGPNGRNPMFSEAGEGDNEGSDDKQTVPGIDSNEGSIVYVEVIVQGFEVTLNGVTYDCSGDSIGNADEALKDYAKAGRKFRVNGDYAVSSIYHHVMDVLSSEGVFPEDTTQFYQQ